MGGCRRHCVNRYTCTTNIYDVFSGELQMITEDREGGISLLLLQGRTCHDRVVVMFKLVTSRGQYELGWTSPLFAGPLQATLCLCTIHAYPVSGILVSPCSIIERGFGSCGKSLWPEAEKSGRARTMDNEADTWGTLTLQKSPFIRNRCRSCGSLCTLTPIHKGTPFTLPHKPRPSTCSACLPS